MTKRIKREHLGSTSRSQIAISANLFSYMQLVRNNKIIKLLFFFSLNNLGDFLWFIKCDSLIVLTRKERPQTQSSAKHTFIHKSGTTFTSN